MSLRTSFREHEVEQLRHMRRRFQRASALPDNVPSGVHEGSFFLDQALLAFDDALQLRPGWALHARHEVDAQGIASRVWATSPGGRRVPSFMEAFDAEPGPWPYLCASILWRELSETGTRGAHARWAKHDLVQRNPWTSLPAAKRGPQPIDQFWRKDPPRDWRPLVQEDNTQVLVRFYTGRHPDGVPVYEHADVFRREGYELKGSTQLLGALTI